MKRGGPLNRGKGLDPGPGLTRKTPMPRGATTGRRKAPGKRAADTGPDADVREVVRARDVGVCMWPGCTRRDVNQHHRQDRGMGGRQGTARDESNSPANLVLACGSGTTGHHGLVTTPAAFGSTREEVVAAGWVIPTNSTVDPAEVPILTRDGWQTLTHEGTRFPCPSPS